MMKNLTLKHRLLLGFSAVFLTTLVTVLLTYFYTDVVRTEVEKIGTDVPIVMEAQHLETLLTDNYANLSAYIVTGNKQLKASIVENESKITAALNSVNRHSDTHSKDTQNIWKQLTTHINNYIATSNEILNTAHTEKDRLAFQYHITNIKPKINSMFTIVSDLINSELQLEATDERKKALGRMTDVRGALGIYSAAIDSYALSGKPADLTTLELRQKSHSKNIYMLNQNDNVLNRKQTRMLSTYNKTDNELKADLASLKVLVNGKAMSIANHLLNEELLPLRESITTIIRGDENNVGLVQSKNIALTKLIDETISGIHTLTQSQLITLVFSFVLAVLISMLSSKSIIKQVDNARFIANEVSNGNRNIEIKRQSTDELGLLIDSLAKMSDAIRTSENIIIEKQQHVDAILNTVADGIITCDKTGNVKSMNPAAYRLFGFNQGAQLETTIQQLVSISSSNDDIDSYLHCTRSSNDYTMFTGHNTKGESFPADLVLSKAESSNGEILIVGVVRDITENKVAHDAVNLAQKNMASLVKETVSTVSAYKQVIQQVAKGDLTQTVTVSSDGELQELGTYLNDMVSGLATLAKNIGASTNEITTSVGMLSRAVNEQVSGASEQAASMSETTSTIAEIKATSAQTLEKAQMLGDTAHRMQHESQNGFNSVARASEGIAGIRDRVESIADTIVALSAQTQQIGDITNVVTSLAQQSKMLALNASIEAVKAGEAGKGFSVVAEEVKDLAEQSQKSTEQVQQILQDIRHATDKAVMATEEGTKAVDSGVVLMNSTGEAIEKLAAVVNETATASEQIVAAVKQEVLGIDQLRTAMGEINAVTQQFVSSSEQTKIAGNKLAEIAHNLGASVSVYKVN